MIIKRVYDWKEKKNFSIQWFDCNFIVEYYDIKKEFNVMIMYKDSKKIGKIEFDPENKNGFNVYFLDNGKTVDTRNWKQ